MKALPEVIKEFEKQNLTDKQVISRLQRIAKTAEEADFWLTDEGQKKLEQMFNDGPRQALCPLDYTKESKAMLCPLSPGENEWYEIELTADTGACDTVIPKAMAPLIPVVPSLQSQRGMEYEIANGDSIPNLGEKRCEMWTEGATKPKSIAMQVADVHKALLSLSRCADMGFESRFGSHFGCLYDTETGEVVPLQRRGNLYVLRAWIRAAPASPFGRQDRKP
jgi:hypothetical protein